AVATAYTETADAAASISTAYSMSSGDTFSGTLSSISDDDWVAVNVVDGQSYDLNLYGVNIDPVADTYMKIYNGSGSRLGFDDNGGDGRASHVWFTAEYTGQIFVSAASYKNLQSGDYQISVTDTSGRTEFTLDQIADQLTTGYWGGSTRRFDASVGDTLDVNITELSADGQKMASWALEAWTAVSGLNFATVSSDADIDFIDSGSG
ncbi:MAG: alkaline metalloproteinase, partial [Gammaproteobacteria bacterium]|nr:alkaline metalloproteinase [Gammaproteobacteria bacterium]